MNRQSEYPLGNFLPPHQMVYSAQSASGFIQPQPQFPVYIIPQQHYPVQQVVIQGTSHPYPPPNIIGAPVPQPSSNIPPVDFQRVDLRPPPNEKRSCAIPIIDPNTKKNVVEDFQQNQASKLRESAEEFIPIAHYSNVDAQNVTETELSALTAQDTIVDLNDTVGSDVLEAVLSFDNTEDNSSLTANIKQIPSNLEQKLNEEDEIKLTSNFKSTILPKKQESHSSLPDAFRDESSRKRNFESYSHAPISCNEFQQFHPRDFDPRNFSMKNNDGKNTYENRQLHNSQNRYPHPHNNRNHPGNHQPHHHRQFNNNFLNNNERNCQRAGSERNLNSMQYSKPYHNQQQRSFSNNSQFRKVNQETTAHLMKDINSSYINSELANKKEPKYDENNNEITEVNVTEESLLENSTENGDSSLNISRYSTKKLTELKESPLVLSKPPAKDDVLLDSSLNKNVWNKLFDKCFRFDEDSNEYHNPSVPNNKSNHVKRTNSNLRYENSQGQLSRSKSANEKQFIKMNLSLKEDVQLNKAENAWKPSHIKAPEQMDDKDKELAALLKNFRSLLNKITEENFEHLVKEINDKRKYVIDSSEKLSAIVRLLFEKSISEPGYASTYAKLCRALSAVHLFDEETIASTKTKNPWKVYLISHCQQEFERSKQDDIAFKTIQDNINNANDTEEIENLKDVYFKIRQRANGTVKFIGELYKINMLTAKIMMGCIDVLITSVTEENIERLCKLLTTVGEKLEGELQNKNDMDRYMQQLAKLKNSSVITTQRIKFDILNVIDLRASKWKQRENARLLETKPQKLQALQEEENKKKRLQQQQLNDYQPKSSQNNLGRQRSQRSFDNDGFRINNSKQFDIKQVNIPKTNNAEVTLGPPLHHFQNFYKPQMVIPPTSVSNSFGNLSTDCDDVEQLPTLYHTRSGSNGKNNRKDKKNGSHSQGNNNNKEKQKARTPSPVMEKSTDNDDDFFMIDLDDEEESNMRLLTEKMQQTFKGKITFDMLITDLKKITITKNILGCVFTDLFDKRSNERKELIELIGEICRKGLITKVVNVDALKLAIKLIPTIICDVPLAYEYFSEYCVNFYENGLITKMEEIESICQNQQNALDIIKKKLNCLNAKTEFKQPQSMKNSEIEKSNASENLNQSEQDTSTNAKAERCLKKPMEFIQFQLKKKHKSTSFLDEIYSMIDKEKCTEASNFIKDLTLTILKIWHESQGKKSQKKTVDLTKLFPLFIRYIDTDISSQFDCINALNDFAFNNSNIETCTLFDLFYDNDVISMEAFRFWKDQHSNSPSKCEALKHTMNFFTKLDEADISDDFNCTSSTIKD